MSEWISVEERLPEECGRFLVYGIENKLTCVWCGKKLPLGRHKYCSDKCTESANNTRKRKKKPETYNPTSGESYAEYQMRRNPKYYKSIYIAPKRKGVEK